MKRVNVILSTSLVLGLGALATLALLWLLGGGLLITRAQGPDGHSTYHVALSCAGESVVPCYENVQDAVDAADNPGDVIKVAAGTYIGVQGRPAPAGYPGPSVITQVVYISKTLTLRGGYTTTNWDDFDPEANPTRLDAQSQGRVIVVAGDISTTLEGLQIVNGDGADLKGWINKSHNAGGGVYVINATVTLSASQVLSNVSGAGGFGGGLCALNSGGIRLSGNTISYNNGGYGGGAALKDSSGAMLDGNTIRKNRANSAGGLYINDSDYAILTGNRIITNTANGPVDADSGGLGLWSSDYVTLANNVIHDNYANDHGGGLNLNHCDHAKLISNAISENRGLNQAGGVRIGNSEHVELANNVITGNHRSFRGAGAFIASSSFVTLTNNVIANNQAKRIGSGMYVYSSSLQLRHTTIARNYGGDGSGIHIADAGSTVDLINTLLVSHTVGITVAQGSTATLEATLWGTDAWANLADWGGAGTISTGTINLWGDPAFVDPDAGDYHISRSSAAIDAGVDAGVVVDIDGESRPSGAGYDIGADEFRSKIYLPLVLHNSG